MTAELADGEASEPKGGGGGGDGGGGAAAEGGAIVAADSAVDFEAAFHRKHDVHEGVVKFNMKPKTGMKYPRKVFSLEETPAATAAFLLATEGLDKKAVGEYLGEGDDFKKQTLLP